MNLTQTRAETKTNHAARVTRRIKGDLMQLKTFYSCCTDEKVENLSHDLELALDFGALTRFTFYLKVGDEIREAYDYVVKDNGELETNDRSGRFLFKSDLVGSTLYTQVTHKDPWDEIDSKKLFKLSWGTSDRPSISHLTSATDGSYSSGNLGVARTSFTRH